MGIGQGSKSNLVLSSGVGTAYLSGAPEFTHPPRFRGVRRD